MTESDLEKATKIKYDLSKLEAYSKKLDSSEFKNLDERIKKDLRYTIGCKITILENAFKNL